MVGKGIDHPPRSRIYGQLGEKSFLLLESTISRVYCE